MMVLAVFFHAAMDSASAVAKGVLQCEHRCVVLCFVLFCCVVLCCDVL